MIRSDSKIHHISDCVNKERSSFLTFVEDLCNRIDAVEPTIQSLIGEPYRRSRLRGEAIALWKRYPEIDSRPPLFGIPVGIKDIFSVEGFETQCGSRLPAHLFTGPEASCVSALRNAGALILGKTVTTEFAYFEPGPTKNPCNPAHTPGGSSSGSAAAVAAGLCPLALGTQTIGSIIRPAAYCGIIGFKPTYGRISLSGVVPYSISVDQIGLFTQDVKGMEIASAIVCSDWKRKKQENHDQRVPVLGIPEGPYLDQATQEARSSFENTVLTLSNAGYPVKRIRIFEDIDVISTHHRNMTSAEFAAVHATWFDRYGELYRHRTAKLIKMGRTVSEEELRNGRSSRVNVRTDIERIMEDNHIDAWISPAAIGTAPEGIASTGDPAMNMPWTHAGMPTITIPSDKDRNGLPHGLQITACFQNDEMLLSWAYGVEKAICAL